MSQPDRLAGWREWRARQEVSASCPAEPPPHANDAVDPDALAEREAIQAEQRGEFGLPVPPEEHARHIAGLVNASRPSLLGTLQQNERLRPAGYYEQLEEMFRPQPARPGTNRCPHR